MPYVLWHPTLCNISRYSSGLSDIADSADKLQPVLFLDFLSSLTLAARKRYVLFRYLAACWCWPGNRGLLLEDGLWYERLDVAGIFL